MAEAVPAAPSTAKTVAMGQWTSPGFLAAAASLMEAGRTAAGKASKAQQFVRTYPYNGHLYELQLRSADHVESGTVPGAEPYDRRGDAVHGLLWG